MKKSNWSAIGVYIIALIVLALALRGLPGNPTPQEITTPTWTENGPLELSPERGRFALLMSLADNHSFHFSVPIARMATPDLGYSNGNYVSLFAPGVSFLLVPGYELGKYFGFSQVGAFAGIGLIALINSLLVRAIAVRLGVHRWAAAAGAIVFLFGTPAFSYAVAPYQHHLSVFLILSSIFLLLGKQTRTALASVWFLIALAIPIDYPNLILLFPIAVWALSAGLGVVYQKEKVTMRFRVTYLLPIMSVLLPLAFFCWVNFESYGDPFQLAGTVASVKSIDANGLPAAPSDAGTEDLQQFTKPESQDKAAVHFFETRNLLNGFYIHLFSPDRGVIAYAPVMLIGLVGLWIMKKKSIASYVVMLSIIALDVLLYSMWGDPWGGWAFGSRYLIPSYALLAIGLAFVFDRYKKNIIVLLFLGIVSLYGIAVSTMGAVTSNANPPQIAVLSLEKQTNRVEKYTVERSYDILKSNHSKSFVFAYKAHAYMTAMQYYYVVVGVIAVLFVVVVINIFRYGNDI
ncbi:hypothetical protein A2837_00260 [Candidatus Kaiserbacteria bacterium RIFCSPHIGHO2_01_FULL_46_22]|uniref:Glycosyltransferase RgtA/B/C/D-like domain-containing protein n=1 Tax=Candidatus Kaiserbacteria bacterium RIFCSPHIGHO2_01_FULL_46_22 TaxID=1798475 RepID=A0A1F6BXI5_9BACT|nr:MAG: hypothetical protein A2837_00260 [Candidatus Kaiserbacteria bacterium RIFCSPHIGHO2_01_FULL_46_22]